jgi:hypothetical protein
MSTATAARLLRTIPTPRRGEHRVADRCPARHEPPTTTTSQLHAWAHLR